MFDVSIEVLTGTYALVRKHPKGVYRHIGLVGRSSIRDELSLELQSVVGGRSDLSGNANLPRGDKANEISGDPIQFVICHAHVTIGESSIASEIKESGSAKLLNRSNGHSGVNSALDPNIFRLDGYGSVYGCQTSAAHQGYQSSAVGKGASRGERNSFDSGFGIDPKVQRDVLAFNL